MTNYRVTNLNEKTPQIEQDRLRESLSSMKGVQSVQLNPAQHEVSISYAQKAPEQSILQAAVKKAGFRLDDRT